MGQLIPVGLMEVLPGDTFQHSTSVLARMSPMVAPVMHQIDLRVHHFYVPNRIIWSDWENFITGGPDGNNDDVIPTMSATYSPGTVLDYLGVPPGVQVEVNSLPLRAYNLIWNEYFRDQDLQAERGTTENSLARIAWEKDYFTDARPWEQKGDDITMPLGTTAPVIGRGNDSPTFNANGTRQLSTIVGDSAAQWSGTTPDNPQNAWWEDPALVADLSNASPPTINQFREAFALQRYAEARARYGSRYTEYLRYLGVTPSDARLQRPEYLGGGRKTMSISEVLQTGPENDPGPGPEYGVGDMFGHGINAMRTNRYRRFFEEHGYVMTLLSVRPKAMYVNGMDRHFLKQDKEDYWQKELMHIGQQPVKQGEVFAAGDGTDQDTFGYSDRYIEYKRAQSRVTSEFRELLNYWHLARDFEEKPALNSDFIECNPSKRIFAEQTQDSLWIMCQHRVAARRLVSKSSASRIS